MSTLKSPFTGPYNVALDQARIGEQISTVTAKDGFSYVTSFSKFGKIKFSKELLVVSGVVSGSSPISTT